jgi:hypothetical protein
MPADLSDAVSAASLVLAVLAALYTLWLPAVSDALGIEPKTDKDDREPQRKQVAMAIRTKAVPLATTTVAASLILLPRGILVVAEAATHWREWSFNDVKALFVLTSVLMVVLASVSVAQLIKLIGKRKQFDPKP